MCEVKVSYYNGVQIRTNNSNAVIPMSILNSSCVFVFFPSSYFVLNKRTGFLIIKENTPPGTYQFQVRVADDVWPDAVSSVSVHVRELRDEAIYNSGSLRLAGMIENTHRHTHTSEMKDFLHSDI